MDRRENCGGPVFRVDPPGRELTSRRPADPEVGRLEVWSAHDLEDVHDRDRHA
ncbi:MAG TPA: hypothetical protein VE074_14580 [Jatrophihabitantaceae bacterium]|nr:hypothetical protein [Jatrophihabitantaceae bacterium]